MRKVTTIQAAKEVIQYAALREDDGTEADGIAHDGIAMLESARAGRKAEADATFARILAYAKARGFGEFAGIPYP